LLPPPAPPLFPYTTLFRSLGLTYEDRLEEQPAPAVQVRQDSQLLERIRRQVLRLVDDQNDAAARPALTLQEFCEGIVQVAGARRSEEHTSELQSLTNLVCR